MEGGRGRIETRCTDESEVALIIVEIAFNEIEDSDNGSIIFIILDIHRRCGGRRGRGGGAGVDQER